MFKVGADYKDDLHTLRALQGAMPPDYSSVSRAKDLGFDRYGVFGEGTYAIDDLRRVVAGLRFDRHEATDYRKAIKDEAAGNTLNPSPNAFANQTNEKV